MAYKNIEDKREYDRKYREAHRERLASYGKQWRLEHSDYVKDFNHKHYQAQKEERLEYAKEYRRINSDMVKEKDKERHYIPLRRAYNLVRLYERSDSNHNRGECTLTAQWVVDNIFSKHCLYCGESDWHLLGCDRIDNDKPHTPNNVVCCCKKCNDRRHRKDFLEFAYSIGAKDSDGLILAYSE